MQAPLSPADGFRSAAFVPRPRSTQHLELPEAVPWGSSPPLSSPAMRNTSHTPTSPRVFRENLGVIPARHRAFSSPLPEHVWLPCYSRSLHYPNLGAQCLPQSEKALQRMRTSGGLSRDPPLPSGRFRWRGDAGRCLDVSF